MADARPPKLRSDPQPVSVTEMARVDLPGGSFDALRAIHFLERFPPHFHDTFAIGVVESGATRLLTPRGEWVARPGTILAFSPGEVHAATPLDVAGFTYRMIYPSLDFVREIGIDVTRPRAGQPLFRLPVIDNPRLAALLQRAHEPLMAGIRSPGPESLLIAGLRELARSYSVVSAEQPNASHRLADMEVAERVQHYLAERFADSVRLGALADVCGMSPFHLIRVFRRAVGVTPYAYLVQLRVNRAQAMLCRGSSVADVAYSCGFADQSHLTRTFKKTVGVPPGRYVRSIRERAA